MSHMSHRECRPSHDVYDKRKRECDFISFSSVSHVSWVNSIVILSSYQWTVDSILT